MEKEAIFNLLLGAVSEGVLVIDEHQIIVEANQSANQIFGYEASQLIKKHLNMLIPETYHKKHQTHFNSFISDKKNRLVGNNNDIFGVRKNGTVFPLEIGLNPFSVYGKNYVMALVIDISLRKKQEQKIMELNSTLERKVEQRTAELKTANEALKKLNITLEKENKKRIKAEEKTKSALKKEQELNDLKTKFLSLVSHEFKTPLSGILTSTMLLSKYKLSDEQEKRNKHTKKITDIVHYLNNILNDFLSVEKLERGDITYNPTTFKLNKVLNDVISNASVLVKDGQKINYTNEINCISLFQDEKIIELALSNIINNALKYSGENAVVDIKASQNDFETIIDVIDNGIGIPEKDQKNIFNRYFRAENTLLIQGSGIGLNIVKNHLKNLKGTISFISKENKGSKFTITIPNKVS